MAVYFLLVIIPIIYSVALNIARDKNVKEEVIVAFFMLLLCVLSFRHICVGADLVNYKNIFNEISRCKFSELRNVDLEFGYVLYVKIISLFTNNFNVFLLITAYLCVCPLMFLYMEQEEDKALYITNDKRKESKHELLTIALFLITDNFVMLFSGLRQAMAISICVLGYKYVKEKKPVQFLICVFFAFLFHKSAIIFVLIYFMYHYVNIQRIHLLVVVPIFLVTYIFRKEIFSALLSLLGGDYGASYGEVTDTGAYRMILLMLAFVFFTYIIGDENKMDQESKALRGVLIVSLFLQIFSSVNFVVSRLNYYFYIFLPCLIPKVITYSHDEFKKLATLGEIVMTVGLIVYFFYDAYFGADILQVFPYVSWMRG